MDLKFSAHTYFMMRNSNLNSVSTENQHEILNKFGKCLLVATLYLISSILKEVIFAGTKFRGFWGYPQKLNHPRNLIPANFFVLSQPRKLIHASFYFKPIAKFLLPNFFICVRIV